MLKIFSLSVSKIKFLLNTGTYIISFRKINNFIKR